MRWSCRKDHKRPQGQPRAGPCDTQPQSARRPIGRVAAQPRMWRATACEVPPYGRCLAHLTGAELDQVLSQLGLDLTSTPAARTSAASFLTA